MANVKEIIAHYDQKLTRATPNSSAISDILAEYRETVSSLKNCSEQIREELSSVVNSRNKKTLDLILAAVYFHPSSIYIESLCALLDFDDPMLPNELIVDLLYEIPSPKSVPYLQRAILRKYSYDAYDEFGVKCLDALAAIDTPEAWEIINTIVHASSIRMSECAKELIDWRESRRNKS